MSDDPNTQPDPDEPIDADTASMYSGLSRARLYKLARDKRLGRQIAGYWTFTRRELDDYKEAEKSKGGRGKSSAAIPSPVVAG